MQILEAESAQNDQAEGVSRQSRKRGKEIKFISAILILSTKGYLMFWMFYFIASYYYFIDEIFSFLSLRDCWMVLSFFLLPALSLLSLSSHFFYWLDLCLFFFSLFDYSLSSNIWIFIHIKKWGTKMLTGSSVNRGGKAENWFGHGGSFPMISVYTSLPLDCSVSPEESSHLWLREYESGCQGLRPSSKETYSLLLALPFADLKYQLLSVQSAVTRWSTFQLIKS